MVGAASKLSITVQQAGLAMITANVYKTIRDPEGKRNGLNVGPILRPGAPLLQNSQQCLQYHL